MALDGCAQPPGLPGWGIAASLVGLVAALVTFAGALTGAVGARRNEEPVAPFVLLALLAVALGAASTAAGAWLALVRSFALAS